MLILLKIMLAWLIVSIPFGLFLGRMCRLGKPTGKYDELLEEVIRADRKCQLDTLFGQDCTHSVYTRRP